MKDLILTLLYKLIELLEGGGEDMVDFFFYRVIDGHRTCNPENKKLRMVPARFVEAVTAMLIAEGLDLDGRPVERISTTEED